MPLEQIASIELPPGEISYRTCEFSHDGKAVLLGTNNIEGPREQLGVTWLRWDGAHESAARAIPHDTFKPDIDSSSVAIDIDGETAIALVGTTSAYRPDHEQLWLLNRSSSVPPRLVHDQQSRLVFSVSLDRKFLTLLRQPNVLERLALPSLERSHTIPFTPRGIVQSAVVSPSGTKMVIVSKDHVVCLRVDGTELCTWPRTEPLWLLFFDDDESSVFGVGHESVLRFPIVGGGAPLVERGVPRLRPLGPISADRTALFVGRRPFTFCELDLLTGEPRSTGVLEASASCICWHPGRRLLAFTEQFRLRVFKL